MRSPLLSYIYRVTSKQACVVPHFGPGTHYPLYQRPLPKAYPCNAVSNPRGEKTAEKFCHINHDTFPRTLRPGAMRCFSHNPMIHVLHVYIQHGLPRIISKSLIFTTLQHLKRHVNTLSCERILTTSYLTLRQRNQYCRHLHGDSNQSPLYVVFIHNALDHVPELT